MFLRPEDLGVQEVQAAQVGLLTQEEFLAPEISMTLMVMRTLGSS